jgi:hypothetical protein
MSNANTPVPLPVQYAYQQQQHRTVPTHPFQYSTPPGGYGSYSAATPLQPLVSNEEATRYREEYDSDTTEFFEGVEFIDRESARTVEKARIDSHSCSLSVEDLTFGDRFQKESGKVSNEAIDGLYGEEVVQVGTETIQLPIELLSLETLQMVLSETSWELLDTQEKESLKGLLPASSDDKETLIKEILTRKNFHFGNPTSDFYRLLVQGKLCPQLIPLFRTHGQLGQQKFDLKRVAQMNRTLDQAKVKLESLVNINKREKQ